MLIGVISDTHDNMPQIRKAVDFFNKSNVDLILHAGDIVAPFTIKEFKRLKSRMVIVFGNNDGEKSMLRQLAKDIGEIHENFYEATIEGRRILVMHEPWQLEALAASQKFDIIIHGHTHNAQTHNSGGTLVINPGECCGWVTGKSTIGLLELPLKKYTAVELTNV
jgi:putative phosphoesterase